MELGEGDSTRPENISKKTGLPLSPTATNCHVCCSRSIEDDFLWFRCDVVPTATPAIVASATWNTPIPITVADVVAVSWPQSFDKPWW
ncbi:MAG: hypothetical protein NT138_22365 [Planctomycetales bacterium]|nr:hypothetical protein [Planctomycetales bacterium]